MAERNYYVLCDDNCRFESMTKEQIYDAIAEATGHTPTPVDEAFITMIKEQNAQHNVKVWKGTAAKYNALSTHDSDTLYFIETNKVENLDEIKQDILDLQTEVRPVSRGGTGASTADTARSNLGLSGAETKTLLWTNSSPSSSFSKQTISLSLNNYTRVMISAKENAITSAYFDFVVDKSRSSFLSRTLIVSGTPNNLDTIQRNFNSSNSGITFDDAWYGHAGGAAKDNNNMIPYKIYGIKKV